MQEEETIKDEVTEDSLGTVEEETASTDMSDEVDTDLSTEVLDIVPSTIVEGEK